MGTDDRKHLVIGGQWRHEVAVRICELAGRLAEARASNAAVGSAVAEEGAQAVARALEAADDAIVYDRRPLRRIHQWWTGAALTRAWESIHLAEAGLVKISSQQNREEVVPRLRTWLQLVLPTVDYARRYEALFDRWEEDRAVDEVRLRQAYQAAIAANVEWHTSLRAFRNVLFYVAGGLLLLLLALAVWHPFDPHILPLCPERDGASECFGGTSPWRSVLEVELVGAFGGLLGSAFLLANLEKPPTRYNVLAPQIVLKAVAGAASALVGLLFLQSGVLFEPLGDSSAAELLSYAIAFGFSQQLVTQMIDKQSATLLSPGGRADG